MTAKQRQGTVTEYRPRHKVQTQGPDTGPKASNPGPSLGPKAPVDLVPKSFAFVQYFPKADHPKGSPESTQHRFSIHIDTSDSQEQ